MPLLKLALLLALTYFPARFALGGWLRERSSLEKVGASLFASCFLFFLAGLASFYLGDHRIPIHASVPLALTTAGIVFALVKRRVRDVWPQRDEWIALLILIVAGTWFLLAQSTVVNYAGGGWSGDWYEHYERALLFDGQRDLDYKFAHLFHLTSRPPLFNVTAYFYMTLFGFQFSDYQVIATFLGIFVLVPASLITRRALGPGSEAGTRDTAVLLLVSILFAMHPMAATNIIYPWSRMLTNAFILMALHLYMRFTLDHRETALALSLLCLAAAHLTHYSADVVVVVITGHLAYSILRSRGPRWKTLAGAAVCALAVNAVWYVWSVRTFGLQQTLTSNSSWANFRGRSLAELAGQFGTNLATTVIPFIMQKDPRYVRQMDPSLTLYWLYDQLHLYWVGTLVGAISTSAVVFCLFLLAGRVRTRNIAPTRDQRFQLCVSVAVFVLALMIVPNVEQSGISHLALQPICILLFLLAVCSIACQRGFLTSLFIAAYGLEAFLFYFLKTLERVTPTPQTPSALYTEIYYENLRLKLVTADVRFLSDIYPGLIAPSRAVLLALIPVLCVGGGWLLKRACANGRLQA